jgi:hypothetical protein
VVLLGSCFCYLSQQFCLLLLDSAFSYGTLCPVDHEIAFRESIAPTRGYGIGFAFLEISAQWNYVVIACITMFAPQPAADQLASYQHVCFSRDARRAVIPDGACPESR